MLKWLMLVPLVVVAACAAGGAIVPESPDPVEQRNSYLCGQMPPSGYCMVPENN